MTPDLRRSEAQPPATTKAEVRSTYDLIAESYADRRVHPWPEVVDYITSLPPASRVLDLGCGHGRHAGVLADSGHRVIGVDFSRQLLARARGTSGRSASGSRVAWIQADASAVPLRPELFQGILCIAVLHHLPTLLDRLAVLGEIRRLLVRGGTAFLSVWDRDEPRLRNILVARRSLPAEERADVCVPWIMPDGTEVPRYYHLFDQGEFERIIIDAGLHGETFFRRSGNRFARVSRDG